MNSTTTYFPGYTIGVDAYSMIPEICLPHGKNAVIIGGRTALEKAAPEIKAAACGSGLNIIDELWFGGETAYENGNSLISNKSVQSADMILAVGGGKAIDCCKYVADKLSLPLFTFPTIASTCAASSSVGVFYTPEHVFKDFFKPSRPTVHVFISTKIIAEAPKTYLWAGIGDGMSKEIEVRFSGRGRENEMSLSDASGYALARCCTAPFIEHGAAALIDCEKNRPSEAIETIALNIIINTGMVSNMVDSAKYNTSLAHAIFNGFTEISEIEKNHLHGEVVSYGTLVLLTLDGQTEKLKQFLSFYKEIGLPTSLSSLNVSLDELSEEILQSVESKYDLNVAPYKITADMIRSAMLNLENISAENFS